METSEKSVWEIAQEGEREWWGDCCNMCEEEEKQKTYAEKMGLKLLADGKYDLNGKSVLDIGGGPVSLLLKCKNRGRSRVVDPLLDSFPDWVTKRYENNRIECLAIKGEDIDGHGWDEVWIYNVLLHTEVPRKVIKNALAAGSIIRIFEWVNTTKNEMHPHVLTKEQLDSWLGCDGKVEDVSYGNNYSTKSYSAIVDNSCKEEAQVKVVLKPVDDGTGSQTGTAVYSAPPLASRHKRFHLPGLPHVATNKNEALACAFSQKVLKMGEMLKSLGHTVFFYGVEGSEVQCDEFIQVSTQDVLKQAYGDYDMRKVLYKHASGDIAYTTFNQNTIAGIKERMEPNDFLLIPFSPPRYKMILDELDTPNIYKNVNGRKVPTGKLYLTVEMGIGYKGTRCKFRVWESNSQRHFQYGLESAHNMGATKNGGWYDAVIPNYFDSEDFEYSDEKQDYFLFLGRVIPRKGIAEVIKTVEALGAKLIIAGQDGQDGADLSSPNVEYVGFADVEKRKQLLRDAKALFLPTHYIEPFGGVIIEAAFSGTPVITSDWGAFPELVLHGKTGYRCHTLDHFVWAAKNIGNINPMDCYNYAMNNFSLDRVRWMYEEYFNMLLDVKENINGQGWNRLHPERTQLDWLTKSR